MEASRGSFSELQGISQNAWFTFTHIYTNIPSKVHYLHQLVQGKGYVGVCMGVLAFGWVGRLSDGVLALVEDRVYVLNI